MLLCIYQRQHSLLLAEAPLVRTIDCSPGEIAQRPKKDYPMTDEEKRRLAELETAQARAGKSAAELQRDVVAGIAVNESVHRAAAETAASEAKMRAAQAESRER